MRAAAVNTTSGNTIRTHVDRSWPQPSTRAMTVNRNVPAANLTSLTGSPRKAMTKVNRYSDSGTTHKSGKEATSVEMWRVTASIRAEGTKAAYTQKPRRRHDGRSPPSRTAAGVPSSVVERGRASHAAAAIMIMRVT
jgi:hypothetical protein